MYGDALTTKERVKDRLKITTTNYDQLFNNAILAVTASIQSMTGRRYNQATYTHELHVGSDLYGSTRGFIVLKNAPIQTISAIQYKAGTNSSPNWTDIDEDYYDVDLLNGLIRLDDRYPGMRNIRVTYVGGFAGYSLGINNSWAFNIVPNGDVDGSNLTFTLEEYADEIIVYADGFRELTSNVTFTPGDATFVLAANRAPSSSIAVDYKRTTAADYGDYNLPEDLVDVCERAVVYLFKMRDNEGRTTESFQESSVTWRQEMFTKEMRSTIMNYRRGYEI